MKTKKIFALLLTLVMLISAVPMNASAAVAPGAPKVVEAECYVDGFELLWDDVIFADGYRVFQWYGGKWNILGDTDEGYYEIDGLLPNTSYRFAVRTFNLSLGKCTWSKTFTTVTAKTTGLDDFGYFEGEECHGELYLEWDYVYGAHGYRVFQYKDGKWVKLADVDDDTEWYSIEKYEPNTTYYFTVRAFRKTPKGVIWNALPKTVKIRTTDTRKVVITDAVSTEKTVTLEWDKAADATGYRVYMYKGGKWTALKTTGALSYTVTGLNKSSAYYFRVKAYKRVGTTVTWYPTSDTCKVITLSDYATRKQAVDIYNKAVNYAKAYQGTLNLAVASTVDIEVTDLPSSTLSIVQKVVDNLTGTTKNTYSFKKGVDSEGVEATEVIYPLYETSALPADALQTAVVKTYSNGTKYIEFTVIAEEGYYDALDSVDPEYNSHNFPYVDFAALDTGPVYIENAESYYPGTTVKAKIDANGRVTALVIESPSEFSSVASAGMISVAMKFKSDIREVYAFSYK